MKQDAHNPHREVEVPGSPATYVLLTALSLPSHSLFSRGVHSKVDDDIDAVVQEVNQQFGAASLQTANSECIRTLVYAPASTYFYNLTPGELCLTFPAPASTAKHVLCVERR